MLEVVGCDSLDQLMQETVPPAIRFRDPLRIPDGVPEAELLARLRKVASDNEVWRSYLGMGYSGTITPGVIQRNILENPGWYTQYTPYQAEIAQGRLEALLNFQTAIMDLTGLEIANASLLDEATAAAEAMFMLYGQGRKRRRTVFLVAEDCHPQTIGVVGTRADPPGIVKCSPAIATELAALPVSFHRDPADGVLVATALVLGATLLTQDRRILDAALVETLS